MIRANSLRTGERARARLPCYLILVSDPGSRISRVVPFCAVVVSTRAAVGFSIGEADLRSISMSGPRHAKNANFEAKNAKVADFFLRLIRFLTSTIRSEYADDDDDDEENILPND